MRKRKNHSPDFKGKVALDAIRALKDCIHHSDRGSQYFSHDYQKTLRQHGFKMSMTSVEEMSQAI